VKNKRDARGRLAHIGANLSGRRVMLVEVSERYATGR